MNLSRKIIKNLIKSSQAIHLRLKFEQLIQSKYNLMDRKYNKGLNIKMTTSLRKDKRGISQKWSIRKQKRSAF